MKRGDVVYYARIFPVTDTYEVDELRIRTVTDKYFVGTEKHTKQAFLLSLEDYGRIVFSERGKALQLVKAAEKNRKPQDPEDDYGEELY